jgi:predicted outer membrane protein
VRRIAAALIVLAAAGCSAGPEAQRPPERRIARPPVVRSIAVSPAQYVARASSASLFAIKASRLVASRSSNAGLASFARQVEAEQEGVGSQLSFAGRRLDLLPSAELLTAHQAMLDALAASPDPARLYVQQMTALLRQTGDFHRQYERYGTSPTLRPVASMAAPVFERELARLRGL